jgi:bacillolysin
MSHMNRRSAALGAALALSLSVSAVLASTSTMAAQAATSDTPASDAAQALSQLRQDANGPVKVARDADGTVTSLSSTDGSAMLDSDASTPAGAVKDTLADYGDAIGIDGDSSKAVVTKTLDSSTGGSVVRAQQTVDGLPVFGGEVVMSLDPDNDVTSITADTTDPDVAAPPAAVDETTARATAVATTARQQHVPAAALTATDVGRRLYDPSVIGADPRLGTRPVWQFTVTHGLDVRETVLVGSSHGEVVLAYNDAPGINRKICDNHESQTIASDDDDGVPLNCTAARVEGGAATGNADVDDAYLNLGEASQAYGDLDGIDLTNTIGLGANGSRTLLSTVRWCYTDEHCPYDNAFWDGNQMVFGLGYATANDVVGHELTHGYVQHTSDLFPIYQSGAINESVADTIGEIVDHRNPEPVGPDNDSAWTVGESLPGGALRSMKDPTLRFQGQLPQPDRMTSPYFQKAEAGDDLNGDNDDDGAVHRNNGVGNKTAYLISQGTAALPGGSFNGHSFAGIDGSDTGLAKTGRLYLETIPRLTSGADYAQLGRTLVSTCDDLAQNAIGGFTSADCTSVSQAVAATQLASPPATAGAAAPKVAVACQTTTPTVSMTEDDTAQGFNLTLGGFWARTPDPAASDDEGDPTPAYNASGDSSLFVWDPGTARNSSAVSSAFTVPAGVSSYLNFQQARQLIYDGSRFPTGGRVFVQKLVGSTWVTVTVPWVNGPAQTLLGTSTKVFGGDSHGYGSSQVDMSSLAGQTARVVFRIDAVADTAFTGGWWVDDLQLYSCPPLPSAPSSLAAAAGTGSATLAWGAPAVFPGSVNHYVVTRSGGAATNVPATTRRLTLRGISGASAITFTVRAVAADGGRGLYVSRTIYATSSSLGSSAAKVKKKKKFVLTAKVLRRGSRSAAPGVAVLLQRKAGSRWVNISSGTTSRSGTKAWTLKQRKSTYYRVLTRPGGIWFGSASSARLVKKK